MVKRQLLNQTKEINYISNLIALSVEIIISVFH